MVRLYGSGIVAWWIGRGFASYWQIDPGLAEEGRIGNLLTDWDWHWKGELDQDWHWIGRLAGIGIILTDWRRTGGFVRVECVIVVD